MPYATGELKTCSACRKEKATSEFRKNRALKDGFANQCKVCQAESNERFLARQAPGYMEQVRRNYTLRKKYGLSASDYGAMLQACGGVCEVCGSDPGDGKNLDVDHDHRTGEVRGLLCYRCNRAMGFSGDDPDLLRALADYLDKRSGNGISE